MFSPRVSTHQISSNRKHSTAIMTSRSQITRVCHANQIGNWSRKTKQKKNCLATSISASPGNESDYDVTLTCCAATCADRRNPSVAAVMATCSKPPGLPWQQRVSGGPAVARDRRSVARQQCPVVRGKF